MNIRLTPTNNKTHKTSEKQLDNGIPYLIWEEYPEQSCLSKKRNLEGARVWIAGSSKSEKWFVVSKHKKGEKKFPDGGFTLKNQYGEKTYVFYEEVVLHPSV